MDVGQLMGPLPVKELPGVGYALERKLTEKGIAMCRDVWTIPLPTLKVKVVHLVTAPLSYPRASCHEHLSLRSYWPYI